MDHGMSKSLLLEFNKFILSEIGVYFPEEQLNNLRKKNILALPIHDSYIVDRRYEEVLRVEMIENYKRFMGYEPIIK